MTEEQWFASARPMQLFDAAERYLTVRQRRLIALAGCRLLPADLLGLRVVGWLTAAERLAELPDVTPTASTMRVRFEATWATNLESGVSPVDVHLSGALYQLFTGNVRASLVNAGLARGTFDRVAYDGLDHGLVGVIRDVVGNPFRPVAFSHEWRTTTAAQLARGMYESRDFSPMPILADALQDAGCDDEAILTHCRDESNTHARGCWVVDLVLGKT